MTKQTSDEFSSGELQPSDRRAVDQHAALSTGAKKAGHHRPLMGRVMSTLDSTARPRRHQFSPTGD